MNGRKAKRLRREIWGERNEWDLEEGLHPRARSYVISFTCTKLIPKVIEDGEGKFWADLGSDMKHLLTFADRVSAQNEVTWKSMSEGDCWDVIPFQMTLCEAGK